MAPGNQQIPTPGIYHSSVRRNQKCNRRLFTKGARTILRHIIQNIFHPTGGEKGLISRKKKKITKKTKSLRILEFTSNKKKLYLYEQKNHYCKQESEKPYIHTLLPYPPSLSGCLRLGPHRTRIFMRQIKISFFSENETNNANQALLSHMIVSFYCSLSAQFWSMA